MKKNLSPEQIRQRAEKILQITQKELPELSNMKTHPSIKLARVAFQELSRAFYSANRNHAEDLLKMCMDGFTRCHTDDTASVLDCAKMFAVKRVAEYLLGEKYPQGQAYLHTQESCFQAAAIADEFSTQVRAAWQPLELRELVALNYTDVVKTRHDDAA